MAWQRLARRWCHVTDDEVRVGIAMNYCAGYIRQQENQQLGIPPEVMATFSPQLRQLCGLGMYRGISGNIEKKSPAELFYGIRPRCNSGMRSRSPQNQRSS